MKGSKLLSIMAALAGLGAAANAHAIAWYFQSPGSQLARDIDNLHQDVMWLIIVIFIGVFGFMFWACYAHRKSKGHVAEQFHENTTVELLWGSSSSAEAPGSSRTIKGKSDQEGWCATHSTRPVISCPISASSVMTAAP